MPLSNKKHQRIAELLVRGLKPIAAAELVGCTPALISQLAKDEEFKEEIARLREQQGLIEGEDRVVEEAKLLNERYEAAERRVLSALEESIALMEPQQQIKLLDTLIARRDKLEGRRAFVEAAANGQLGTKIAIANITIPSHALPEVFTNETGEITQIGSRMMAPMSSSAVTGLLNEIKEKRKAQNAKPQEPQSLAEQASLAEQTKLIFNELELEDDPSAIPATKTQSILEILERKKHERNAKINGRG